MAPQTIFFIGKPGSGKGTQAELLAKATGWPVKVTSDGLREIIAGGGKVGQKLKETIDAGILTPSWFPGYVFLKWLFALKEDEGVIFDGFNRKPAEAQLVTEALAWIGRPYVMLHLDVSDEEVRKRLSLRAQNSGRADDHAVDKRMEEYYGNTEGSIGYLRTTGKVIEINGEGAVEDIAAAIRTALNLP